MAAIIISIASSIISGMVLFFLQHFSERKRRRMRNVTSQRERKIS